MPLYEAVIASKEFSNISLTYRYIYFGNIAMYIEKNKTHEKLVTTF